MFTRFSKSSIVNKQPKLNSALAGNPGLSVIVFQGSVQTYVDVTTLSNSYYFSYSPFAIGAAGGGASKTRGVTYAGYDGVYRNITYVTFAARSDAQTFGNIAVNRMRCASASNPTIAVINGGDGVGGGAGVNNVEYVTIATLGNGVSAGGMSTNRSYMVGGGQSPTRGVFGGGWTGSLRSEIDYVTFASMGGTTGFGNLTVARYMPAGFSSDTRAVWGGGAGGQTTADYITIASTGSATSFGTLIYGSDYSSSAGSSNVRGIWSGSTTGRQIYYVTIASTGNGTDFGTNMYQAPSGTMQSNHGGLQ